MSDILERAKAVDPEMLAVLNWGALRDLISELIAEVEAKQANNEYLQKMTEEAQGIMQESQLLLCKEANEAEQLQNEVERLRSENKIISDRAAHHDRQDAKEIELLAARIAELEAGKLMYEEIAESYQIGVDDLRAYIKRLEAAFLGATKEIVYAGQRCPRRRRCVCRESGPRSPRAASGRGQDRRR